MYSEQNLPNSITQQIKESYKALSPLKKGSVIVIAAILFGFLCCCSLIFFATVSSAGVDATATPAAAQAGNASPNQADTVIAPPLTTHPTETVAPTQPLAPTNTAVPTPTTFPTKAALSPAAAFDCVPSNEPQFATLVEVVDGDTIKVIIDGSQYTVRYIGMDTPETHFGIEPFGPEAADKNAQLLRGQPLRLYRDRSEVDKYGRLLRYVFAGDLFVNNELVRLGLAEAKDYRPDTACTATLHQTQNGAMAQQVGMWVGTPQTTGSKPTSNKPNSSGGVVITEVDKIAEVVTIKNSSNQSVNLSGWRLLSDKGDQSCLLSGVLDAGATLKIYSLSGEGFSCGFSSPIWSNSSTDTAILYDPSGSEVSRY